MDAFKMARRNVWRSRRRSAVSISAMSLALLVMILYAGLVEGYLRGMERSVLDLEVGDVQLFAADYRESPSLYARIEEPEPLLASLDAAGFPASGRLLAYGMAASGAASAGVSFRGVDVARDTRVSRVHEELAEGRWLDPADPKGVVVGRRLARTLGVGPGSELVVLTQGADGAMAYDLYRVRGVLRGIGDATDRTGVFTTAATLRDLLVLPGGVHQIIVRRPEGLELPAAARQVGELARDLDVQTWRDLLPTVSSMMDSVRSVIVAMFFIVYVVIGILILNAMLMAVFERIREIGVLKALGAGPFDVFRLVGIECGIQVGLAIAIGVALSVPGLFYLSRVGIDLGSLAGISVVGIAMDPIWRAAVGVSTFTEPIAVLLAVVAIAVSYPTLKAALVRPVEAMRQR